MSKVTICLGADMRGEILVDGEPVMGCERIEMEAKAGEVPRVKLSLIATKLEVEAEGAEVTRSVPSDTRCTKCGGGVFSTAGLFPHEDPPMRLLTCYFCGVSIRRPM